MNEEINCAKGDDSKNNESKYIAPYTWFSDKFIQHPVHKTCLSHTTIPRDEIRTSTRFLLDKPSLQFLNYPISAYHKDSCRRTEVVREPRFMYVFKGGYRDIYPLHL